MRRRSSNWLGLGVAVALVGCGDDSAGPWPDDAGPDATVSADATTDAPGPSDAMAPDAGDASDAAISPGYALRFDDSVQPQYLFVPDAVLLNMTTAFTVEAWVDVADTDAGQSSEATLIAQPYGTATGDSTTLFLQSGALYAGVNVVGATIGAQAIPFGTASGWHHVAWTYDRFAGALTVYVDDQSATQPVTLASLPYYDGHSLFIGANALNGTIGDGFDGTIDDVRIYSTARSKEQIATDATGVSPLNDPTLVAYYPFDDGFGPVAHDASPNHLDGWLGGAEGTTGSAPTWVASTVPFDASAGEAPLNEQDASVRVGLEFGPTVLPEYVEIPDVDGGLRLTGAFTYEMWIASTGQAAGGLEVLQKPYGANTASSVVIGISQDNLYAGIDTNLYSPVQLFWTGAPGAWHHVAFTYDSKTMLETLYVDGACPAASGADASACSLPVGGPPQFDPHSYLVGAGVIYDNPPSLPYLGLITDLRIFNAARSASQIQEDMAGGSPLGDPTLVAYYPFDEGSGRVVHDRSSHGFDGTFGDGGASFPTWVTETAPSVQATP